MCEITKQSKDVLKAEMEAKDESFLDEIASLKQVCIVLYTSENTGYCGASLSYCALILSRLSISSKL